MNSNAPDFIVEGSTRDTVWLVRPQHTRAIKHLKVHVSLEASWLGDALVVEHRYIADLVMELRAAGFIVRM